MSSDQFPFSVLYEDNHLLALNKPVALPTMGVPDNRPTLLSLAKDYIRQKYNKPGEVYLGIVSRLDAPVSGVVLIARTSKAAARLTTQFRQRLVEKLYWAVVEGDVSPEEATLTNYLRKDERHRKMHTTNPGAPDAREAILGYQVRGQTATQSWLEVRPVTGRKHQIRVQLAKLGHPILGDRKYGSRVGFPAGIALHARQLTLEHPVRHSRLELTAPLPPAWKPLTRKLVR